MLRSASRLVLACVALGAWSLANAAAEEQRSSMCAAQVEHLWERAHGEAGLGALDPDWYDCSREPSLRGRWACEFILRHQLDVLVNGPARYPQKGKNYWHYASGAAAGTKPGLRVPLAAECSRVLGGAQPDTTTCWSGEDAARIRQDAALPRDGGNGSLPLGIIVPYHKMGCVMYGVMFHQWTSSHLLSSVKNLFKNPEKLATLHPDGEFDYLVDGEEAPEFAWTPCSSDRAGGQIKGVIDSMGSEAPVRSLVVMRHFADSMISAFHYHVGNCKEGLGVGVLSHQTECLQPRDEDALTREEIELMQALRVQLQTTRACDLYKMVQDEALSFRLFTLSNKEQLPDRMGGHFCSLLDVSTDYPVRFLRYRDIHCSRGEEGKEVLRLALTWLFNSDEIVDTIIDPTYHSICEGQEIASNRPDSGHVSHGGYDQWEDFLTPKDMQMMEAYGITSLAERFGFVPPMPQNPDAPSVLHGCVVDGYGD